MQLILRFRWSVLPRRHDPAAWHYRIHTVQSLIPRLVPKWLYLPTVTSRSILLLLFVDKH